MPDLKIIWLDEEGIIQCHQDIIDNLAGVGIKVDKLVIDPPQKFWDYYSTKEASDLISGHDLIISATHSGNPHIAAAIAKANPRLGIIDIEHDFFRDAVEIAPLSISRFVFCFSLRAEKFLSQNKYRFIKARWPKIDLPPVERLKEAKPFEDAVLIADVGSRSTPIPSIFNNVWFKGFRNYYQPKPGMKILPRHYNNARGTRYLNDVAKFWLVSESSSYLDGVLFGCFPILHGTNILSESRIDDIVSLVKIEKKSSHEIFQFNAITLSNLDHKISKLRKSEAARATTISKLRETWFPKDYESWPSVSKVLAEEIGKLK